MGPNLAREATFARAALVLILLVFGIAHLYRASLQAELRLGGSVHARAGRRGGD